MSPGDPGRSRVDPSSFPVDHVIDCPVVVRFGSSVVTALTPAEAGRLIGCDPLEVARSIRELETCGLLRRLSDGTFEAVVP